MEDVSIVRLRIRGRVHGVGYRAWTHRTAVARGLAGWVRNRSDGSVEAVLAGSPVEIEAMIGACRRGPSSARVDSLDIDEVDTSALDERVAGETVSVLPTV